MTPTVADDASANATSDGVNVGVRDSKTAATPATCGVAIEVPEIVFVAVAEVIQSETMYEPGAKRSTHDPKFE